MLNTKFLYFLHLQTQSKYLISSGTIIIIFVSEIFNNTTPEDKGPQRSERELSESPWSEDDEAIKVAPTPPRPVHGPPTGGDPVPYILRPVGTICLGHCSKYCRLQLVKDNARAMAELTPIKSQSQSTDGDESESDILIKSSGIGQWEDRRRKEISRNTEKSLPALLFT